MRFEASEAYFEAWEAGFEVSKARFEVSEARFEAWGPDERGGRTNEWTNESPPVFYRTSSPSGPLPKKREREVQNVSSCNTMGFYEINLQTEHIHPFRHSFSCLGRCSPPSSSTISHFLIFTKKLKFSLRMSDWKQFHFTPWGEKGNDPNVTKFLTTVRLHVIWQNIILGLVYALNSKHFTL